MTEISLEQARDRDAELLTEISRRAFDSDCQYGAPGPGGPPGYDSVQWQRHVIRTATAYLKILAGRRVVGALIVFRQGPRRYNLGRMFVDPEVHRQGIGSRAVERLFERFPLAKEWTLDTPAWNTRTPSFYEKLGFVAEEERHGLRIYGRRSGDSPELAPQRSPQDP